jgi:hypothetical protein
VALTTRIVSLISAEPGWRAVFTDGKGNSEQTRVIGWGLLDPPDATGSPVVGLVLHAGDPTRIVPAPESAAAGFTLEQYGYKHP